MINLAGMVTSTERTELKVATSKVIEFNSGTLTRDSVGSVVLGFGRAAGAVRVDV